ncbi:MAG: hypothetical protein OD811_01705 [Alphaproteobacteria bacterium]
MSSRSLALLRMLSLWMSLLSQVLLRSLSLAQVRQSSAVAVNYHATASTHP